MGVARIFRGIVYKIESKGAIGSLVYHRIKYGAATLLGKIMGEERYAKWFYHLYTKRNLDLENPERFDEKVWWLKLNNRDPMLTKCSDKVAVRDYVKECGLEEILIPQLDVFESVDELDLEKYTCEIIVKCNHNSGGHLIYDPNSSCEKVYIKNKLVELKFIMKHNAYVLSREWNYKNIPHKVLVEKVIRDKEGKLPLDYKFMCFDGEPKLLFLDLGVINKDNSYNHNYPRNIYDMDFNHLDIINGHPNSSVPLDKPLNFNLMKNLAEILSEGIPHVRIDFYEVNGQVFFGEYTFYHYSGFTPFVPDEWDYILGKHIDIWDIHK